MGYYCDLTKKWIRCEVDKVAFIGGGNGEEHYIFLWAIDYGFPFHTTKLSKLIPIPEVLKHPSSKIFAAGLSVMPIEITFDHINARMQAKIGEIWTDRAIKTFEKCIREAQTVWFVPSTKVSHHEVLMGDLNVTVAPSEEFVQVSQLLVKEDLAIMPPYAEFVKCYKRLFTNTIERWNDYRRSGGVLKLPGDIMLSPITLELTGEFDGCSSIGESYREAVNRKVRDWQKRNDSCNSSDLGSEVGSPPPSVTSFVDPLAKRMSKTLADMKSNIERKQRIIRNEMLQKAETLNAPKEKASSTSSVKRVNRPVFVAAGAAFGEAPSHRSWQSKSTKSPFDDLGSLVNEEFISISEVGSRKQED